MSCSRRRPRVPAPRIARVWRATSVSVCGLGTNVRTAAISETAVRFGASIAASRAL